LLADHHQEDADAGDGDCADSRLDRAPEARGIACGDGLAVRSDMLNPLHVGFSAAGKVFEMLVPRPKPQTGPAPPSETTVPARTLYAVPSDEASISS
jgi:hypothetical protein